MSSIDWKNELAQIEREFDGLPPKPSASPRSLPHNRPHSATPVPRSRSGVRFAGLAVWARLGLVGSLAGALALWPYPRECGLGLYAFMGAAIMIVVGGIWVGACTWSRRMGFAHMLAFVLVLVGLAAVAHQVLPRVGYARINLSDPPRWQCSAPGLRR